MWLFLNSSYNILVILSRFLLINIQFDNLTTILYILLIIPH